MAEMVSRGRPLRLDAAKTFAFFLEGLFSVLDSVAEVDFGQRLARAVQVSSAFDGPGGLG